MRPDRDRPLVSVYLTGIDFPTALDMYAPMIQFNFTLDRGGERYLFPVTMPPETDQPHAEISPALLAQAWRGVERDLRNLADSARAQAESLEGETS